MNKYRCPHCGQICKRDSVKQWVKSFCLKANKNTHLILIVHKVKV
jgi:hypothetical protein